MKKYLMLAAIIGLIAIWFLKDKKQFANLFPDRSIASETTDTGQLLGNGSVTSKPSSQKNESLAPGGKTLDEFYADTQKDLVEADAYDNSANVRIVDSPEESEKILHEDLKNQEMEQL